MGEGTSQSEPDRGERMRREERDGERERKKERERGSKRELPIMAINAEAQSSVVELSNARLPLSSVND